MIDQEFSKETLDVIENSHLDKFWIIDFVTYRNSLGIYDTEVGMGGVSESSVQKLIRYYWTQMSEGKKLELINAANQFIEEDLLSPLLTFYMPNVGYFIDLIILIDNQMPGKLNYDHIRHWININFPNLNSPDSRYDFKKELFYNFFQDVWICNAIRNTEPFYKSHYFFSNKKGSEYIEYMNGYWKDLKSLHPLKVKKTIEVIKSFYQADLPYVTKNKINYVNNLIHISCLIESDEPGTFQKEGIKNFYQTKYLPVCDQNQYIEKINEKVYECYGKKFL